MPALPLSPRLRLWLPFLILAVLLAAFAVPLILQTGTHISGARDELFWHYRTIRTFRAQFPNLDLRDYPSATTPLYHILLMLASFIVGLKLVPLRFSSAIASLLCLLVVYLYLFRRGQNPRKAFLFSLIFISSPYFLRSSVMLFTDNTATLFALLTLLTLDRSCSKKRRSLLSALFATLAILTRQSCAWLIGTILFAAVLDDQGRIRIDLRATLAALLPIAGLGFFVLMWGGLTPERYLDRNVACTLDLDIFVYIVAMLGLYGTPFLLWLYKMHRPYTRAKVISIAVLLVFGLALLLLCPVSPYQMEEAGGALYRMTTLLPILGSTSIVYWLLFPPGLVYLYVILRHLAERQDYLILASFFLWLAANLLNRKIYQRYYEPFVLFLILYSLVPVKVKGWRYWLGPVGLIVAFAAMDFFYFFTNL